AWNPAVHSVSRCAWTIHSYQQSDWLDTWIRVANGDSSRAAGIGNHRVAVLPLAWHQKTGRAQICEAFHRTDAALGSSDDSNRNHQPYRSHDVAHDSSLREHFCR